MTEKHLLFAFIATLGLCFAGIAYSDVQLNDQSQPAQLGSRLALTASDLERTTSCAKGVVGLNCVVACK